MRIAGVVAAVGGLACFDPHPQAGSACLADGRCPDGLVCRLDVCVLAGAGVDGPDVVDGTGVIDGPLLPDAQSCASWQVPNLGDACLLIAPGPLALVGSPAWSVNTDTGEIKHGTTSLYPPSTVMPVADGVSVRVFSLTDLTIQNSTDVSIDGDLGVIFVVHGSATITGSLSASAALSAPGAGAPSPVCAAPDPGITGTVAGGGGGGAGFGKEGGDGSDGAGDGLGGTGGTGGARGQQSGNPTLVPLFAGCPGAPGAGPAGMASGGGGGGAIEISARDALVVSGEIAANGGGGLGGAAHVGGGGGGAGGGILLEASTVNIAASAIVAANGGGGGGGGGFLSNATNGGNGRVGDTGAPGGTGMLGGGGSGGRGGYRGNEQGDGASPPATSATGGGGGGGGGVGRIRIQARGNRTIDANATISPSPD